MNFINSFEKIFSKKEIPEIKYFGNFGRMNQHYAFIVDGVLWVIEQEARKVPSYRIEKLMNKNKDDPRLKVFLENTKITDFRFPTDGDMEPDVKELVKLIPPKNE
jgi:hypothetical protein